MRISVAYSKVSSNAHDKINALQTRTLNCKSIILHTHVVYLLTVAWTMQSWINTSHPIHSHRFIEKVERYKGPKQETQTDRDLHSETDKFYTKKYRNIKTSKTDKKDQQPNSRRSLMSESIAAQLLDHTQLNCDLMHHDQNDHNTKSMGCWQVWKLSVIQ